MIRYKCHRDIYITILCAKAEFHSHGLGSQAAPLTKFFSAIFQSMSQLEEEEAWEPLEREERGVEEARGPPGRPPRGVVASRAPSAPATVTRPAQSHLDAT